ncbi:uncharacterized protein AB675_6947 [Cyphellophora attinorum]|uniref:Tyrosinase copper-binding domain-containing protein n=1 Tax=Cyphellophora attinorum TaxID=1664694 RepID=A0A0N1P0I4_9EURO|nr:uncharacterized protein AB675_6947 [Phialophora attinorum]KPI43615.1 hypothetical protein AB675_6947 [Phialophora attinorum]
MLRGSFLALTALLSLTSAAPAKRQWGDWQPCNNETIRIRKDFNNLCPEERKAFTDAINCIRSQPSNLDQAKYPAAINRYFDWATVHVNRTNVAHLSGYFLTWHRMFIHLFEEDLRNICGFEGTMPYWNWPATADDLANTPIFNGDAYSMSGDGAYIPDRPPTVLAPGFSLPTGLGGGCVTTGPFAGMNYTMQPIPIQGLILGSPLPPNAFANNGSCLTRDLNPYVAQRWDNWTAFNDAIAAPNQAAFSTALNGVFGGTDLGLHSGAHFIVGNPASNIYVSAQDPIWYPLHTFLDLMYVQWQKAHPEIYDELYGTMTANNAPPSANVTLDSMEPDWGYFGDSVPVKDLISTTAGPFCYDYEFQPGPYTEKRGEKMLGWS